MTRDAMPSTQKRRKCRHHALIAYHNCTMMSHFTLTCLFGCSFLQRNASPQYNSFRYARLKGREGGEGGKGGVEEGKWGQVVTRDSGLIQLTPSGFFSFQNRGEHNCNANTTKFKASERLNWRFRRKPRYFGLLACWENAHETQFPILPVFVNRALLHFVSFRFKELKAS